MAEKDASEVAFVALIQAFRVGDSNFGTTLTITCLFHHFNFNNKLTLQIYVCCLQLTQIFIFYFNFRTLDPLLKKNLM